MQKKCFFGKVAIAVLGMAIFSGIILEGEASAASGVVLSHKHITIQAGKNKTLRLKNNKAVVKWSITSGKEYIKLGNKTKKSVKITARKKEQQRFVQRLAGRDMSVRLL